MDNSVILRSRVRIARNIKDYPFPPALNDICRKEIIEKVASSALPLGFVEDKGIEKSIYAHTLFEENLISHEFATEKERHSLFKNDTTQTYIMVCEEDHLRIQSFFDGLNIDAAAKNAIECERFLGERINFAFNSELGYLTRCPTNLGTAMRASVMIFLPAITLLGRIGELKTELEKVGITIRGMYGEGSAADAYIYQISNRLSLGYSEDDIIRKTKAIANRIENEEIEARTSLLKSNKDKLIDKVSRALGTLKYAHIISSKEFLECFAYVRLGMALGIIAPIPEFDSLLHNAMPAHILNVNGEKANSENTRDILRARIIKSVVGTEDKN